MSQAYNKLINCYNCVRTKTDFKPKLALVLGSGLGDLAEEMEIVDIVNYGEIEGFPVSTVHSHKGRFVFGYLEQVPVVCMQGRVHFYEGYAISDVVLPIRLMKLLGADSIFLSNASGGINENFHAGDFMMITDHISSFVPNPLVGENVDELGVRFPDMVGVYDKQYCDIIRKSAKECNIDLKEGVYVQSSGPSFESPAEIRAFKMMGADAVGMSTVCEAIAARHCGMRICGISCVSNMAAGITGAEITASEVNETTDRVGVDFRRLVRTSIRNMADFI